MGKLFSFDADTKSVIQDALDDIVLELGKDCLLVYPPRMLACANCLPGIGGQPSNRWKHGGPIPFAAGSACPLCGGSGRRAEEVTDTVHLSCEWNPKEFKYIFPDVEIRDEFSTLWTKGFLSDAPKIVRADHLRMQVPVEGVSVRKMKLQSMPSDRSSIIQDRYFVCYWSQTK